MTNTIPNVPRELKPCPFCGDSELLGFEPSNEGGWTIVRCRRCGASGSTGRSTSEWEAAAYWNRRAPSPAGVDGLKRYEVFPYLDDDVAELDICEADDGSFVKYDAAAAIIDGLRGEVAELRKRAKTAEREAGSALRTYKGLEKVARVVSDNSDQVCGELNVLRQQFDQQAQRICELEGLLREVHGWIDESARVYRHNSTSVMLYRIDAALSAGKEGE